MRVRDSMTDTDNADDGEEEEYGELERHSGMPDDGSSGDELADGAVPHGYGDAPDQSDDKENA